MIIILIVAGLILILPLTREPLPCPVSWPAGSKGPLSCWTANMAAARVVKKMDGAIWTFDLTDWRGTSIQKDLNLRDFTINALAMDILDEDDGSQTSWKSKGPDGI